MNKVQQVQNFFNNNPTMSRKDMINHFVNNFGLTEKGAPTYYSNAKRAHNGGSFHQTQPKDNIVEVVEQDKDDDRTVYSLLTIVNGVVDSIHSFFSRPSKIKEGQLLTDQYVEIGQTVDNITIL